MLSPWPVEKSCRLQSSSQSFTFLMYPRPRPPGQDLACNGLFCGKPMQGAEDEPDALLRRGRAVALCRCRSFPEGEGCTVLHCYGPAQRRWTCLPEAGPVPGAWEQTLPACWRCPGVAHRRCDARAARQQGIPENSWLMAHLMLGARALLVKGDRCCPLLTCIARCRAPRGASFPCTNPSR